MKMHLFSVMTIVASVGLFISCKESSESSGRSSSGQTTASEVEDPSVVGYLLYKPGYSFPDGTVLISTENMSMKDAALNVEMQGQKITGTMTRTGVKEIVKTIDSAEQITVAVIKNESEGTMDMDGNAMPQPKETEGLHGKTAIFTLVDGKWSGELSEGEVDDAVREAIKKRADNMNDPDDLTIMGTGRRKVGDTWDVDPSKLSSFAGSDAQKLTGVFKMTFQAVEQYKGVQCAILVAVIDVTGKTDEGQDLNLKGKVTVKHSLKYHESLAYSMIGQFSLKGEVNGGAGKMTVSGPMILEKHTDIKLPE